MRGSKIFFAVFASTVLAVPTASPLNEASQAAETVNAQQGVVLLTALELARRFQRDDKTEPIIRALQSPDQFDLNGIFGQLSAAIPFDISPLAGFVNGVSSSSPLLTEGSLGGLSNILSGLGITPPSEN